MKTAVRLTAGALACSLFLLAQENRPSPPATSEVVLNTKSISMHYSRPSARGRKIVGGLVPFGEVWRTGANEATTFTTPINLTVGGVSVPAGSYTLYTLPEQNAWKLIVNKQTGQWGTEYDEKQDLARIDLKKSTLTRPVEVFTISFDRKSSDSADLVLQWELTSLSVPIKAK